jgi:hypothetical protein
MLLNRISLQRVFVVGQEVFFWQRKIKNIQFNLQIHNVQPSANNYHFLLLLVQEHKIFNGE